MKKVCKIWVRLCSYHIPKIFIRYSLSSRKRPFPMRKGPGKRGHIVADTSVSSFARARNICCRHKFCVRDAKKNVSEQNQTVSFTRALSDHFLWSLTGGSTGGRFNWGVVVVECWRYIFRLSNCKSSRHFLCAWLQSPAPAEEPGEYKPGKRAICDHTKRVIIGDHCLFVNSSFSLSWAQSAVSRASGSGSQHACTVWQISFKPWRENNKKSWLL